MLALISKFRLWLWDMQNADVLSLAQRRQTMLMGHGCRSEQLDILINEMLAERDKITLKEQSDED